MGEPGVRGGGGRGVSYASGAGFVCCSFETGASQRSDSAMVRPHSGQCSAAVAMSALRVFIFKGYVVWLLLESDEVVVDATPLNPRFYSGLYVFSLAGNNWRSQI